MADAEKVLRGWERCKVCNMSLLATPEGRKAYVDCEYTVGLSCRRDKLIDDTITLLKENEWIPFKFRPMTDEEIEYFNDYYGEGEFEHIIVENTPDDGEEVLVSYNGYVFVDTYCADHDGVGFESHDEIEEGMAWMPLPKPYNKER